jgi:flap endonuclease-1
MGIKDLNHFLTSRVSKNGIYKTNIDTLSNKVITIDISIYIYKFLAENELMMHMYWMISHFIYHKITPIFIFDGKTPVEKRALVERRRIEKRLATEKYNELLSNGDTHSKELEELRKKTIRLKFADLDNIKLLLNAFGICHMRAEGEADVLCAQLVKLGIAWGCMSDDMDLLLYDCTIILRNFNLYDNTLMVYDKKIILENLDISNREFLEMVVINGTDYNEGIPNLSIAKTYEIIKKGCLYDFFDNNEEKKSELDKICQIFYLENKLDVEIYKGSPNWVEIRRIMQPYGFIFI